MAPVAPGPSRALTISGVRIARLHLKRNPIHEVETTKFLATPLIHSHLFSFVEDRAHHTTRAIYPIIKTNLSAIPDSWICLNFQQTCLPLFCLKQQVIDRHGCSNDQSLSNIPIN
ncbi:hypothetical protein V6N12_064888 [Hibiscus sabdariffa]|uniref:Uncharacterized protein n=1 Tax=Hibiscus sabdariffa TaxID=183260 RepID=A0ABR2G728_9ROSI